jgi:hypothetical protein
MCRGPDRLSVTKGGNDVGLVQVAARRFGIAGELLSFLMRNKRWWMVPIIIVLLLIGVLMVLAQSSVIAPFIYTLF